MKIAIYGYGNLGRGAECAIHAAPDCELFGIFTRRDPASLQTQWEDTKVYPADALPGFREEIDVVILCGGSATDLPRMTPELAAHFNVVDSFDTHAAIPGHFEKVDEAARASGHTALISCGWDPGLFSLNRLYASAVLPNGTDYTFWGKGVSQGHSDAIRRIPGVLDARQYTVPVADALASVRSGANPKLSTGEKHLRECYVVAAPGEDLERIRREIVTMPHYFADYTTTVHFISPEEMARDHSQLPHGGVVIRTGTTGREQEHCHRIEYSLQLDSNPEFTASVLVAYARAIYKLHSRGVCGCHTVFEIAPADLSPLTPAQLRALML